MAAPRPTAVTVIDFRRQSMILEWNVLGGTWTACDVPPTLVHGIALIRASQPNICIYGRHDRLNLQVGSQQYALSESSPRVRCTRGLLSFGLRRRFAVESGTGAVLYTHSFWTGQGGFFRWLAARVADPMWRTANGRLWSMGIEPARMRAS